MVKKKDTLVPYELLSPGFEAIYTGKKASSEGESDNAGNEISRWPVITWTFPGQEKDWDEEIKHINTMQSKLGDLDDSTRQIRAHIGSLVPCDSGLPVTVDELLNAIGRGKLEVPSFHNGCWCSAMWWKQKTTQPFHMESMRIIHTVLTGYLAGKSRKGFVKEFPSAAGFINRTYEWLGPVSKFTEVQKLMMDRMLLTIDYFTRNSCTVPSSPSPEDIEQLMAVGKDLFEDGGRGVSLDVEISKKADLPKFHSGLTEEEFQENLEKLESPQKKELYKTCTYISSGVYGLSDCHHNTFRFIERWIHGIGAGKSSIPTRKARTEKERLGHLLFGYVLGLDKWLIGVPIQFLLLDLGHIDLGFEVKNEILRVYAYLGEKRTPVKEWLAACLWYNLTYSPMAGYSAGLGPIAGYPVGLVQHKDLLERAEQMGISPREWMDSALGNSS